jgi:hypothetical protein
MADPVPARPYSRLKFADVWGSIFIGIYFIGIYKVDFQMIEHEYSFCGIGPVVPARSSLCVDRQRGNRARHGEVQSARIATGLLKAMSPDRF